MSNTILVSKRITMQISALENQKSSGDLGKLYIDDGENGRKIEMGILHSVFCHFQELD